MMAAFERAFGRVSTDASATEDLRSILNLQKTQWIWRW